MGPITAVAFKAALDDPNRFHDSRAVGAYFGLTPKRFQSGQRDSTGHISRAGEGFMRSLLFEAALCLYFRSKRDTPLRAWAAALAARSGTKKAIVALARKLAVILHAQMVHGLVHGRDFDDTIQAAAVAA